MVIKSQKDFFSGLMFIAVGGGFAYGAIDYELGNAARMGPGYFPVMLGILLMFLGLLVVLRALRHGGPDGDKIGTIAWRPLGFVIGANLAFGVLLVGVPSLGIPAMGLIVAIFALVIIAGYARKGASLKESLVLSVALCLISYGAFVKLLNLQFPVWPSFLAQ